MRNATTAHVLANTARMRGDRRRHVPVLLLQIGVDIIAMAGVDVVEQYRVIAAPTLDVARGAKEILIGCGWQERTLPGKLGEAGFSLSPPNGDCSPAGSGCMPRDSQAANEQHVAASPVGGESEEGKQAATDNPVGRAPNLGALAILQQILEHLQGRASSDSSRTQEYLREARSGGMYGYGDGDD